MKLLFASLFVFFFQTSFAQKYEYNILGEHFSDTIYTNKITQGTSTPEIALDEEEHEVRLISRYEISNPFLNVDRKAIFEEPEDTTYIYHQIGKNENIEYILNLYQICTPCFAKWNSLKYTSFDALKQTTFYEGDYLKVALKKDYENGTTVEFETRILYENFDEQTYLYTISDRYGISVDDLRRLNNLGDYVYEVEDARLIVGKIEYKYACSCLE